MTKNVSQITMSGRAWTELGGLAGLWGASFLAVRICLDEIGPLTTVAHRVFWASLALWIVVWLRRIDVPRSPRIWGGFLVMGVLNNVLPFSLLTWGQLHIESGLTAIFNASTAVFGVLAAAIFFADERLTPRKLFGVCLGFAGVATAIGLENLVNFDLQSLAQIAVLGATLCYALASVWARKTLSGLPPQVAAAGMLTGAGLVIVPLALVIEGMPRTDLATETLGALAYISLLATAGAYLLYYRVLAMAGSGNLMLVTLLVAPLAIVLGAVVRHETLPLNAFAGFALLAIGLVILDGRMIDRRPTRG